MRRMNGVRVSAWFVTMLLAAAPGPALARVKRERPAKAEKAAKPPEDQGDPAAADQKEAADQKAGNGIKAVEGPKQIELGNDLVLDLPAGMLFVEKVQAKQLMERMGNIVGDS